MVSTGYVVGAMCSCFHSRTVREWHSALVVKRVFFECFDCFMPLFYIAFFQLDVVILRAEIVTLFMSESSPLACAIEHVHEHVHVHVHVCTCWLVRMVE